jgi:hypothetical protein
LPSTSTGVAISSPDIKTTIQTLVNRSGWASGNAMLFVIKNNDTNNIIKQFYSANNGNYIPSIEITYTASNTAPTQPGAFVSPTETMLLINQTHRLEWGASTDANGDTITYEVENSTDGGTTYSAWYTTSNVYVDFTPNAIATRKFRVRAKDSVGAYSGYTYSITYTIYSDKTQLGTYKLMGKNGILEIPVYDPNTSMSGKNMLRTFLSDGTVACFELQDTDGTEIIKVMGKTKIKGVKI